MKSAAVRGALFCEPEKVISTTNQQLCEQIKCQRKVKNKDLPGNAATTSLAVVITIITFTIWREKLQFIIQFISLKC